MYGAWVWSCSCWLWVAHHLLMVAPTRRWLTSWMASTASPVLCRPSVKSKCLTVSWVVCVMWSYCWVMCVGTLPSILHTICVSLLCPHSLSIIVIWTTCIHAHTHTNTHTHKHIHKHIHTHAHTHTHKHIHTHITHTHITHTYTQNTHT